MTVEQLRPYLREHWPRIKAGLLAGEYQPLPVRKVEIPKPGGQGMRMLGIPTVIDRLIQQALHQVLSPLFEPSFSESSYGFRPQRSAQQAVLKAREYVREGRRWVVDIDLEKFFDRVNHDVLMSRLAGESVKRLKEKLRKIFRRGRGRNLGKLIEGELTPLLRGWMNYFRLAEVKGIFEELDSLIRRKLGGLIWRQWKRPLTRLKGLIQRGLDKMQARKSASNGRGSWWNAGAAHMHAAFPKSYFDRCGLLSLLEQRLRFKLAS